MMMAVPVMAKTIRLLGRRTPLKDLMYAYGLRAGLPFRAIKIVADWLDTARRPAEVWSRRAAARRLLAGSRWRGFVPVEKGFALIDATLLPDLAELARVGAELYRSRAGSVPLGGEEPFYDILTPADLAYRSIFLDIALGRDVVEIVADYLGTIPRLHNIMLCVTPGRERVAQSQLYHLDKPDVGFIQMFINVLRTRPENGPLTFLPADVASRVRDACAYDKRGVTGDGRLTDTEVFAHARAEDVVAAVGDPGAGVLIDTSRCLHFGSRCRDVVRVVCIIQYAPAHKIAPTFAHRFDGHRHALGPLKRMLLDGAVPPMSS